MPEAGRYQRWPKWMRRRDPAWSSFKTDAGGSYAYCVGYMDGDGLHPIKNQGRSQFALLSDAPSFFLPDRRSAHHGGRGQNILYEDGRVAFVTDLRGDDRGSSLAQSRGLPKPESTRPTRSCCPAGRGRSSTWIRSPPSTLEAPTRSNRVSGPRTSFPATIRVLYLLCTSLYVLCALVACCRIACVISAHELIAVDSSDRPFRRGTLLQRVISADAVAWVPAGRHPVCIRSWAWWPGRNGRTESGFPNRSVLPGNLLARCVCEP